MKKKLISLWNKQNISTKIILIIGFLCLINIILSIFTPANNLPENNTTIKSVISSIFGYVLGNNCKPNKLTNEGIQVIFAGIVSIVCLTSLFITNFIYSSLLYSDFSNLNEVSDLLLLSIGFLISKSKEK